MALFPPQDRLVRKETALGTLRELEPPKDHIGLRLIAPWMEVPTDDVIFDYAVGLTDGLAPARAEDAESELAQKDLVFGGTGRASVIDWALKDRYTASDVQRYRENLMIAAQIGGVNGVALPGVVTSQIDQFRNKVAREDAQRRRKLDNRVEWLILTPLDTGGLAYDDGKIKFSIDYGRPANQTDQMPGSNEYWSSPDSDPINDTLAIQRYMYDLYGVRMTRAIGSKRAWDALLNSSKFVPRFAPVVGGTPSAPIDPAYMADGWGPQAVLDVYSRATGVTPIVYDSVYRTRAQGSTTIVNNRFTDDRKIYFLPDEADVADLDDEIGFAKTLTSPHPEGNFQPSFYEWEEETKDPWGVTRGTGIKAFPIFMHLEWTYSMQVLA